MCSRAVIVSLLPALLAACHRGSGSPPPPTLAVVFPPPFVATDLDTLLLRGHAAGDSAIATVTVGSVPATSTDGFANWRVRVPLTRGENLLQVRVTDDRGATTELFRTVHRHAPIPARSRAIAVDVASRAYYLADDALDAVLLVEPSSGERSVVSSAAVGTGPELIGPAGLAFEATTGRLLVADDTSGLVFVDPTTGDRAEIQSSVRRPVAVALLDPTRALVVEARLALSVAFEPANLVLVDLTTGGRTLVSSAGFGGAPAVGTGPAFAVPVAVVADATASVAWIVDAELAAVVRVELATGDRTVLSGPGVGGGPDLSSPTAAVLDAAGNALLVTDAPAGAVFSVDVATGDRALASGVGRGAGVALLAPSAILRDAATGQLAVADLERDTVVAIDPATGDRRALFEVSQGAGPAMRWPGAIAVDPVFGELVAVDETDASLIAVQPMTGDRQVVHPRIGPGLILRLSDPHGLDLDGATVLVLDQETLWGIDLVANTSRVVSGGTTGSGPPLSSPFDVALDPLRNGALVTSERELVRVDLALGDRTIVSSAAVGGGPAPFRLLGLAIDEARARYLAIDATDFRVGDAGYTLFAIDPTSGDRTALADWYRAGIWRGDPRLGGTDRLRIDRTRDRAIVPDPRERTLLTIDLDSNAVATLDGDGVELASPRGIALAADGALAFVTDADRRAIVVVDLETGERAILSF